MTEYLKRTPSADESALSPISNTGMVRIDDAYLASRIDAMTDKLIASAQHEASPSDSYRRLLHKAMLVAAEAQRELYRREREVRQLRKLSITDEATQLLNRRGFDRALERALARSRRSGARGLLVMIDLNGFKDVNDTYGHLAGDYVLASVASVLRINTRNTDDVARFGGDEFAIIMNDADQILGYQKAMHIDGLLNGMTVSWDHDDIEIGASIGIAPFGSEDDPKQILKTADDTMYRRKKTKAISRHAAVAVSEVAAPQNGIPAAAE